jgi:hypothetical protein
VTWLKFSGLSGGAPDSPVSQKCQRPTVIRAINVRHVAHSNGRLDAPDCPVRHLAERSNGRLCPEWKEIVHRTATVVVRWCTGLSGAPPVHHSTEGKIGLPSWPPTAPSCVGAIKGTPRRMEHDTKLARNILRLPDFASTHLIRCVSDLSSV